MTKSTIELFEKLVERISIDNNPETLDDDGPDMLNNTWIESVQELVNFINAEYEIFADGVI